jgi:hypothetical protein
MLARALGRRRLSGPSELDGVVLGVAVGSGLVRWVGNGGERGVALGLCRGGSFRGLSPPDRPELSSCSSVGLPASFVCERSSSTRGTSERQRSSAASSASKASAAPFRASATRYTSGAERAALRSITSLSLEAD